MKKIGWSLLHLRMSDGWQLVCDRCRVTPVTPKISRRSFYDGSEETCWYWGRMHCFLVFFAPQEQGESKNPQSDEHPEAFQSDCSVEGEEDHPL